MSKFIAEIIGTIQFFFAKILDIGHFDKKIYHGDKAVAIGPASARGRYRPFSLSRNFYTLFTIKWELKNLQSSPNVH